MLRINYCFVQTRTIPNCQDANDRTDKTDCFIDILFNKDIGVIDFL
jgi:hypothetical protein